MAAKGGKKGVTTPKGKERERMSPLSPTRLSRLQEKEELQGLNDRLAAYIDKVRQLELENSRLTVQVESMQESVTKEVKSMKGLYEQELGDARRLLDDTAKERAMLQIDLGKLQSGNEEVKLRLIRKEREVTALQKSVSALEGELGEAKLKLSSCEGERRRMGGELRELRDEVAKLTKQLKEAKEQLESETLMRVDLENRCQSLKEELQFKQQVFEQEVTETKTRKQIEVSEIDGKLKSEYDARLQMSLQELREDYEEQLRSNREEVEELFEDKLGELTRRDSQSQAELVGVTSNLREARREVNELTSRLAYLEGSRSTLEQRVSDLEKQLESERDTSAQEVEKLKGEIDRLNEEISTQLQDYQDLMGVKVALDMEISAYRKLLEAEEQRLNITSPSAPSSSLRRTPMRGGGGGGGKRKRAILEEEEERSSSSYTSSSSSSGSLEIKEDCPEGKYVKIINISDKDVSLGGYQIVREVKGESMTTYKFHSKSKLQPRGEVTIYSCDQEATHDPPKSIVMKNQKWAVADAFKTKLIAASEEVATRESKREREVYSSHIGRESHETKDETRLYAGCVLA